MRELSDISLIQSSEKHISQQKIKIAASSDGHDIWGHLLPIVEYCLDNGCKVDLKTPESPFYQGRDGAAICYLVGDISIQNITDIFLFPDSVTCKDGHIADKKNPVNIIIYSVSKYETILKQREDWRKKRDIALQKSRKRRAERDASKARSKDH